ncbi:MMPL family transporter [Nocardia sp. NBC_00565]|uniref:MMPL family transporter n=1 Tax=Nocardia sp. NBC_00565 TaxID=2975993 RepID=UPI002E812786|nr:MMPL family transporter [Nocardia sp. NBC_00565]WUC07537.1 MMPL family transporter [Nocardia sp. NBC_00565]
MSRYLFLLGRLVVRRRWWVLVLWVFLLVGGIIVAVGAAGKTSDNFTIPGTESQDAVALLQQRMPAFSGAQMQVTFATPGMAKVTDAQPSAEITRAMAGFKELPQVAAVVDPLESKTISPDQRVALGSVQFSESAGKVSEETLGEVDRIAAPARDAGLQVEFSGGVYPGFTTEMPETPEIIGIIVAFLILMITFGAVVAAGLPVGTALIGVGIGVTGILGIAAFVDVPAAALSLALMLGLSCGIDYALFILSRHRHNIVLGMSVAESIPLAVGTAGSSVVFAAVTVIIALCGLSVAGIPFLTVMGLTAAGAVLAAMLVALTLLPALLSLAGGSVAKFISPPLHPDRPEEVARIAAYEPERTMGHAWGRFVTRFRVPLLVAGVAVLVTLAIPVTRIHLGLPSGASQPQSSTAHKAYDLIDRSFGPGFNGPLLVAADMSRATDPNAAQALIARLQQEPNVAVVQPAGTGDGLLLIQVVPKTGPDDSATADLVTRLRDDRTAIEAGTGANYLVGGTTAANIDTSSRLAGALPIFLTVVVGLALILLTIAFRTVLVPLSSIVGFILSVFAALGAQVAVFQWGWGASFLGVTTGQTLSFLPIIILAIIFGLSSDYQIFVVSRIKEEYSRSSEAIASVQNGVAHSARVVTAAALIMFGVFVAFVTVDNPVTKPLAFTLAVGVILDAFVVRLTLVPAVMALIGDRMWYHPRWFARIVPDLDIEGTELERRVHAEGASLKAGAQAPQSVPD